MRINMVVGDMELVVINGDDDDDDDDEEEEGIHIER
jgi:hypothetical protein